MDRETAGLRLLANAGIDIATATEYIRYNHKAGVYCPRCQRWAELKLRELVMRGEGDQPLASLPLRCRLCGARGELQVRSPAPEWGGATWSIRE
ncbi:MAG TPA: hypothetical protein VN787_04985 [Steroidobacteraceae bacterium]|nr:hypothetical protein [Steroidobacteraceae bacterium]